MYCCYNGEMATWIGHLRIAENLLKRMPELDEAAFTFGSIAPDSGVPNADWTRFDPPKEVSHFLSAAGEGEIEVEDLRFYQAYLRGRSFDNNRFLHSFMLGYYIHLVCDRLAMFKVGLESMRIYPELFSAHPETEAWDFIKQDWYGLDQLYVRDHPDSLFWRVFLRTPIPISPLPFVPQASFEHQVNYIRRFYSEPSRDWIFDRPFPYLNQASMNLFVDQSTRLVMKVLDILASHPSLGGNKSALELLPPEDLTPLPSPLGDIIPSA